MRFCGEEIVKMGVMTEKVVEIAETVEFAGRMSSAMGTGECADLGPAWRRRCRKLSGKLRR
jgi:hypothetical protein